MHGTPRVTRQRGQIEILLGRRVETEALRPAVPGKERKSGSDAPARSPCVDTLSVQVHFATTVRIATEENPRQFGPTRTHESSQPEDFAPVHREAYVALYAWF